MVLWVSLQCTIVAFPGQTHIVSEKIVDPS